MSSEKQCIRIVREPIEEESDENIITYLNRKFRGDVQIAVSRTRFIRRKAPEKLNEREEELLSASG